MKEIERRFLLRALPNQDVITPETECRISQHYLNERGEPKTIRIRKAITVVRVDGEEEMEIDPEQIRKYFYTTKERISKMSCEEIEKEITREEYVGFEHESKRQLTKYRYVYQAHDGLKWEIDDFKMNDDTLIIAEIEMPSEDHKLFIPLWLEELILLEITGMKQFSNSNLAKEK